jgi:hypothetical protein
VLEQALGNSDSVEHHHANNSHAADVADLSSDVETLILLSQVRISTAVCSTPLFLAHIVLNTVAAVTTRISQVQMYHALWLQYKCIMLVLQLSCKGIATIVVGQSYVLCNYIHCVHISTTCRCMKLEEA